MSMSLFVATLARSASSSELAVRPPMGWRSWNAFGGDIDQRKMMDTMVALASRKRSVDGQPTSLADLGYRDVGLDDNWQRCGSYGAELKYTYHLAITGEPVVDEDRFPDLRNMTSFARSLGLRSGWYLNNCICRDHCEIYEGDAAALLKYGFESAKLDNCGVQTDLDKWFALLPGVVIENCHWGQTLPTADWCPFHVYRTSVDVEPTYASVLANLETVFDLAAKNLSRPGCWAYPDMLELGEGQLSEAEARSHFAAWAVVSSPLILSTDLARDDEIDDLWPLIANPDIIAVNQAYVGFSGGRFKTNGTVQMLYKPTSLNSAAVLVLNTDDHHQITATLDFADVPGLQTTGTTTCALRDLFARTDLGTKKHDRFVVVDVPPHDAAFLLLFDCGPPDQGGLRGQELTERRPGPTTTT
mmetsp:Transcript_14396/g.46951  ORF Transcript_14396/g.46951 Transcript_14396/m.46951 type:complete len:415 (-) Transcript_14396:1834-3078(-)